MKPIFKLGEFALVEGQIVEIIDLRLGTSGDFDWFKYKVRLNNESLTMWINETDITRIKNQAAPKVLFGKFK